MTQENYSLHPNDQLPAFWLDAIQELLSGLAPNIRLTQPTLTSLRIAAVSSSSGRQGASVNGFWRYVDTDKDATHPGGAAGTYNIWIVCSANNIVSSPAPFTDNTDYSIYPQILPTASTPSGNTPAGAAIAGSRLIGKCEWDGINITGFWLYTGATDSTLPMRPQSPASKAWALKVLGAIGGQDSATPIFTVRDATEATHLVDVFIGSIAFGVNVTVAGTLTVGGATVAKDLASATYAKAYMASSNNLSLGSPQRVPLDTAATDPHGLFSPIYRYVAPQTGTYLVIGQALTSQSQVNARAQLFVNGTQVRDSGPTNWGSTVTATLPLNAGDYVELFFFANGSGAIAISPGIGFTALSAVRIL